MLPDAPRPYLAWYRPAVMARLVRIALTAAVVMTLGMALLGVGLWSPRLAPAARPFALIVGGVATLFGPVSMILRLHRLLMREDGYLGLRADGVEIHLSDPPTFFAWDELVGVSVGAAALGAEGPIELHLRTGGVVCVAQEFTGASRAAIARELETTRKRAGLGLIRT